MRRTSFTLGTLFVLLLAAPLFAQRRPPALPPADRASVGESLGIVRSLPGGVIANPNEHITTHPIWLIRKFRNQAEEDAFVKSNGKDPLHQPYEVVKNLGNLLTTVGATYFWNKATVTNGPPQTMDAAHTRILSDDSTTAAAASDTNSSATAGSTHQFWQQASSVTQTTSSMAIVGSFGANDGNFAWQSVGIEVGANATASSAALSSGGILLTHRVVSSGTKANPAVWQATVTVTLGP